MQVLTEDFFDCDKIYEDFGLFEVCNAQAHKEEGTTTTISGYMSTINSGYEAPRDSCLKKTRWNPQEDQILADVVSKHGSKNWGFIANFIPGRTGKQCRERWITQHDPTYKRDSFTAEEDSIIIHYQKICGNKWAIITKFLKGRSTTSIKNRWKYLVNHNLVDSYQSVIFPPENRVCVDNTQQYNSIFADEAQSFPICNEIMWV